jgi:hypothetical protein
LNISADRLWCRFYEMFCEDALVASRLGAIGCGSNRVALHSASRKMRASALQHAHACDARAMSGIPQRP